MPILDLRSLPIEAIAHRVAAVEAQLDTLTLDLRRLVVSAARLMSEVDVMNGRARDLLRAQLGAAADSCGVAVFDGIGEVVFTLTGVSHLYDQFQALKELTHPDRLATIAEAIEAGTQ